MNDDPHKDCPAAHANEHLEWLAANEHNLAPLTGTDAKALRAIDAAWHLYAYSGRDQVLQAIALLAGEMQASTRPLARELIARAMDWVDRDRLWPRVLALQVQQQLNAEVQAGLRCLDCGLRLDGSDGVHCTCAPARWASGGPS